MSEAHCATSQECMYFREKFVVLKKFRAKQTEISIVFNTHIKSGLFG